MNQQIYKNLLERKNYIYYSLSIFFEEILVNIDKAKTLTKTNQP